MYFPRFLVWKYPSTARNANMGNASSQYMLGYMYEFGYVKKDIPLAIKYFSMASKQGEINSNHHLAMLYQQDECKNYHKAFKYAKMSADNCIPEGEFILANLLYMGRGCQADEKKLMNITDWLSNMVWSRLRL